MTALHLMVVERKVVTERTVVTEKVVVVRTAQTAMTTGITIKAGTMTGACSMPSSQRADASTKEQTSQAEEPPQKKTEKEGAPPPQPPAKGANKRKGKTPCHKFPGFLQDGAQYTGPCLRKAMGYPKVNRKKPVLYLHPIHKAVAGKEALQNVGYSHRSWEPYYVFKRRQKHIWSDCSRTRTCVRYMQGG